MTLSIMWILTTLKSLGSYRSLEMLQKLVSSDDFGVSDSVNVFQRRTRRRCNIKRSAANADIGSQCTESYSMTRHHLDMVGPSDYVAR